MTLRASALALLSATYFVSIAAAQHPCGDDASLCGKAAAHIHAFADGPILPGGGTGEPAPREAMSDTDLIHCDLEFEVFPATTSIAGHNTMTVRSLVDGLTEFTFRLRSNFSISAVTLNGSLSIPPAAVQLVGSYTRRVTLDRAYNTGEQFTIRIDYNGAVVSRGFGSIEFRTQDGNPLIFSLSEPYYAATWWPVKDGDVLEPGDNKDKFTIDMAVIAPAALTSVGNGLLVGIDDLGSRRRFRWSSAYPTAAYLVFFSTSVYNTWSVPFTHAGGSMPVEFAIFPSADTPGNRSAWELCVPMLGTFGQAFGPYPFIDEKYGIYNFGFGGGMEHQTYTGQGGFGESLTAHELGHQWWGDNVTCRTWHDIWLNEGFATFSEAIWIERRPGSAGFADYRAAMNARRPSGVNDTVYVYDASNVSRIFNSTYSYRKGAWVVHMLRGVVGDDVFFDILADYRATFGGSAATTDDFAAVAMAVSGMDLTAFFEQWVYQPGAPIYSFGWRNVTIAGSPYLQLHIRQTHPTGPPAFVMPIDMRIEGPSGATTSVVQNTARLQHYLIPLAEPAVAVGLDDLDWILNVGKSSTTYFDGPPKVVSVAPAIGAELASDSAPTSVSVQFSEAVTVAPTDFTVIGPGGAVPFTLNHNAVTYLVTLEFGGALPAGTYQIAARSTLRSAAANAELDGEITTAPVPLPSGDGLPGGDAQWSFRVRPACSADLDGNEVVDLSDLAVILSNFGTPGGADPSQGDLDGDADVDLSDLAQVLAAFGTVCE